MMEPLALFIGRRFSRAKQRNKLVSFVSISSVIGISVGVMVVIIGLSAMNGFERELHNRILSVIPHAQLEGVDEPIKDWQSMRQTAIKHPKVVAGAPYVLFTGLIEKGAKIKPVQLRGVDLKQEPSVSNINQFVLDNDWQTLVPNKQAVILGKGLADELGVKKGDMVTALLPSDAPAFSSQKKMPAMQRIRLQVTGIFNLGGQADQGLALLPIADAKKYRNMGDAVSGVALKLSDPLHADEIAREVGLTLEQFVYLKHWINEYGYLYRDIQMVRTIVYIVMFLVIGVASFNIVSTLMMAVKDRASDIAVLRTMGAKDWLIRNIFIWHGLFSGILGGFFGSVFGATIAFNLTHIFNVIEKTTGKQFLSSDVYFVNFLPTAVYWSDILFVSCVAVVLSLFATWYPAQRACRLQPAVVLSAK